MVEVRERPILYTGEMVRSILREVDPKTMTRRVIKSVLTKGPITEFGPSTTKGYHWHFRDNQERWHDVRTPWLLERCPYGQPGDLLYVKEEWRIGAWKDDGGLIAVDYRADGYARQEWLNVPNDEQADRYYYQSIEDAVASEMMPDDADRYSWEPGKGPTRWRRARYMPKLAARIWLRITDVRVERVQDITPADCIAEGVRLVVGDVGKLGSAYGMPRPLFQNLWDSINAKRGYGWEKNPWVWVISFERVDR